MCSLISRGGNGVLHHRSNKEKDRELQGNRGNGRRGAIKEGDPPFPSNGTIQHKPDSRFVLLSSRFLDQDDSIIYAIVGICFFLGAIFTPGYSFWDFGSTMSSIQVIVDAAPKGQGVTQQTVVAGAIIKLVSYSCSSSWRFSVPSFTI